MKKYRIEIKWGVIFSVVMLVWMLLERISGLHSTHIDKHAVLTNLFAIPAIVMYVFALLEKRRKAYNGTMTYMQGFATGIIITIVVTILSPLNQLITSLVITPDFFTNAIEYAVESGKMTREQAEGFFSLKTYILQGLIGTPVVGLVTSAIVAIFTRKKVKA